MAKYRKRPVIIEAEQYWPMDAAVPEGVMELPPHAVDRLCGPGSGIESLEGLAWIETLEGGHIVTPGDWIITGVQGEKYPCKDSIFKATYEPVEEE